MTEEVRAYRTGQGVPLAGTYLCQSGAKAQFTDQDKFPVCPVSNKDTYWEHEE